MNLKIITKDQMNEKKNKDKKHDLQVISLDSEGFEGMMQLKKVEQNNVKNKNKIKI